MNDPYWSVAMTKSQSEHIAQYNLERQNFECYLPKFLSGKGKLARARILFPRYIFVKIELQWSMINGTRGISRVLTNELKPVKVSERIISGLKAKEDENGFVMLPEQPKFSIGDTVRVVKGPLLDYIGIFNGMKPNDRVNILIQMLGREVPVELDEEDLVAVAISEINKIEDKVEQEEVNE